MASRLGLRRGILAGRSRRWCGWGRVRRGGAGCWLRELRAAFNPGTGWNITTLEPDRVQTRYHDHGAPAWLATIKRF
jgi:hypothetical protein